MDRAEAVAIALERDGGCCVRDWLSPCVGPLDGDEGVRRSQGGDPCNPDDVQILCRSAHTLFDNMMPKAKKILGLAGQQNLEWEQFLFYQETPQASWDDYVEAWRRTVVAEYQYMLGMGKKPQTRYRPD